MMSNIEDKLSKEQRLRTEALALAIEFNSSRSNSPETIVKTAEIFEKFIKGEDNLSNVLETLIIKNENIPKNLILMKTENETKIIKVED